MQPAHQSNFGENEMTLIPQWKLFYKRWSTWLLLLLGSINLNDLLGVLPSIQQYMDPDVYRYMMIGLPFLIIIVTNIRQNSLSGPKP